VSASPQKQPELYNCIDPALGEIIEARNGMIDQMKRLEEKLADLIALRTQKQAASLALAAEDVVKTSKQIASLAEGVHKGIAKRLKLESRI
jgi:hypothetical protein